MVVQDKISFAAQQKIHRRMALNCRQMRLGNAVNEGRITMWTGTRDRAVEKDQVARRRQIPRFRTDFAGQRPDVIW